MAPKTAPDFPRVTPPITAPAAALPPIFLQSAAIATADPQNQTSIAKSSVLTKFFSLTFKVHIRTSSSVRRKFELNVSVE
jgi:hypothetical protein